MATKAEITARLIELKFDPYTEAVRAFQRSKGLQPDGVVGFMTTSALFPPKPQAASTSTFSKSSKLTLEEVHPLLQRVLIDARKKIAFELLDGRRNRKDQEKAFNGGFSKVHFGNSAHNYTPALAVDFTPVSPFNWNDLSKFIAIGKVIAASAKALGQSIRWLGDPNGDGKTSDGWDWGHVELNPWRDYKKDCKLYGE